ncbi:MAG: GNAT family N-acetyltransferase [Herpetosiphonaceae bacterium]|nr:GNAT family N-acetyltransferase [Herpetosiphonaceae bacterium]
MSLFRRHFNWHHATIRRPVAHDIVALRTLLYSAERRLLSSTSTEAETLVLSDPALVVEAEGRIQGVLGIGWLTPPVAWIRTLVIDGRLPIDEMLQRLLPPLYQQIASHGITLVAVTVDDWSLSWLRGPLERTGYEQMVDVIGYQKLHMTLPSRGSEAVVIRPAQPDDLAAVLELDHACFPVPWVKGEEIFAPAIVESPCFFIALLNSLPVGYAFATVHQGGRVIHLVRIAVAPQQQGQGVGVRLLAEVVRFCARQGTTVLSLNTQADNYRAQRLYEWFGFTRSDDRQRVFGSSLAAGAANGTTGS